MAGMIWLGHSGLMSLPSVIGNTLTSSHFSHQLLLPEASLMKAGHTNNLWLWAWVVRRQFNSMTIWQNISSGLPQGPGPPQPWVLGQVYRNRHAFPFVEHVSSSIKIKVAGCPHNSHTTDVPERTRSLGGHWQLAGLRDAWHCWSLWSISILNSTLWDQKA